MTDKELKKLNRAALLELLLDQSKETAKLQKQLDKANADLAERRIELENIGNIAEASLALNGVFTAAQAAADQYLESVKDATSRQQEILTDAENEKNKILDTAHAEAERVLAEAQAEAKEILAEAEKESLRVKAVAEAESNRYWQDVTTRLEQFYAEHVALKELLDRVDGKNL